MASYSNRLSLRKKIQDEKKPSAKTFDYYQAPACEFKDGECMGTDDPSKADLTGKCAMLRGKCWPSYHDNVPVELVDAAVRAVIFQYSHVPTEYYRAISELLNELERNAGLKDKCIKSKHVGEAVKWQYIFVEMNEELEKRKREMTLPAWIERDEDNGFRFSDLGNRANTIQAEYQHRQAAKLGDPYFTQYPAFFPH